MDIIKSIITINKMTSCSELFSINFWQKFLFHDFHLMLRLQETYHITSNKDDKKISLGENLFKKPVIIL